MQHSTGYDQNTQSLSSIHGADSIMEGDSSVLTTLLLAPRLCHTLVRKNSDAECYLDGKSLGWTGVPSSDYSPFD